MIKSINTDTNKLTEQIIGAAIEVHRESGPDLLESAYQSALVYGFTRRGIVFEGQKLGRIRYKYLIIEDTYPFDFIAKSPVVAPLTSVASRLDIHEVQVLI